MFCNLIGEEFPADAIKFNALEITLCSGATTSTDIATSTKLDSYGDFFGGYYDETWYGVGQIMLSKFVYDPVHNGSAVEIKLQFLNEAPVAMHAVPQKATSARGESVSSCALSKKPSIKTEPVNLCDKAVGPEFVQRINISLGDVMGPFMELSDDQQEEQSSKPFEAFGMYWLLTIEKEKPIKGEQPAHNLFVFLWCLSCNITTQSRRDNLPLKKGWDVPDAMDGQPRFYQAREGLFCNLIGEDFPADAIKFDAIEISLRSGATASTGVVTSMKDGYGGYYDETWLGVGQVMIENFEPDPVNDGGAVEFKVQFLNEEPVAMHAVSSKATYAREDAVSSSTSSPMEDTASSRTSSPKSSKKRKVSVKTEN
ncbi:MAG: hypothetical protein SGARI_000457 [Bacillariaceae sp.]